MSAIPQTQDWPAFHTSESTRREFLPDQYVDRRPLLDRPSEPHPILSLLMDEALRRIMLTSDGAVMALRERTTGGYADTREPTSTLAGTIDELGSRFANCKTHRTRLAVIKEAQGTAIRLAYSPDRSMVRGTQEWREAIAADTRSCRVLAEVWGVSKSSIAVIKKRPR